MSLRYKLYPAGVGVLWGCIIITVRTHGIFKTKQRGRKVIPPLPNSNSSQFPLFSGSKMTTAQVGINDRLFPEKCSCFASDTSEITEMSALIKETIEYPVFVRFMSPVSCKRFSLHRGETDERTPP